MCVLHGQNITFIQTRIDNRLKRKVVIVGAGAVGSTYAYSLAHSGLAEEIVLIDKNESLAKGQVLDLVHGQFFFPPAEIKFGTPEDYSDAQLIVITAGVAQKPGESRLDLLNRNAAIVQEIIDDIKRQNSKAVILMVTNPVDIMTYVALKRSGFDRKRVIGSGTVLDSARFRHLLSRHCGIDPRNVHAYILGEHGDSQLAAWSMVHIGGIQMDNYCPKCHNCPNWQYERKLIEEEVRNSAYKIINYKGATWFAIGVALVRITAAILRGERSILTVSVYLDGEFGLHDVCLSVPCVLDQNGISKIVECPLPENELTLLKKSANLLKQVISQMTF